MKPIITIPKPCHENWNLMTAAEQGRHCKVCSKTVIDFTQKTDVEIASYIAERENEKMCGRFRNDQIETPVTLNISLSHIMRPVGFHPMFMLVLLIVFGTTLFSCTDRNSRVIGSLVIGNPVEKSELKTDSNKVNLPIDTAWQFPNSQLFTIENLHNVGIMEMPHALPEVNFANQVVDTVDTVDLNEITVTGCTPEIETYTTTGAIVSRIEKSEGTENENLLSLETVLTASTGIVKTENENQSFENRYSLFPNPAVDELNIACTISKPSTLTITLYDTNGKLIKHITRNKKTTEQDYSIPVSVENLKPGVYFVSIVNGEEVSSLRFVKE